MMRETDRRVGRRSYLKTTGLATAGMIGLAGCTGDGDLADSNGGADGDGGSETGVLSTSVTDQPNDIGDFESLTVTIDGIWIKPADAADGSDDSDETDDETSDDEDTDSESADDTDTEESAGDNGNGDDDADDSDDAGNSDDADDSDDAGNSDDADDSDDAGIDDEDDEEAPDGGDVDQGQGRRYIEFDEPQEADLVQLQGDNTQLIDETEVDVGTYLFLQLNVSNTEGVLADDGSEADVETPGNAPLQFKSEFDIRADEQTRFVADFAPLRRGRGSSYIIRPVATGTKVLYGDEEYTADDGEDEEHDDSTESDDQQDESTTETQDGNESSGGGNGTDDN